MRTAWPVVLVATTNPGKIREIAAVMAGFPATWHTLGDLAPIPEPPETGTTFAENARLKAVAYAGASGLPTVAEDSGLAIDALDGRPGVHSARYPGGTYAEKFTGLYEELAAHARPWSAQFVAAVAFAVPDGKHVAVLCECQGHVAGEIVPAPRGSHGFGYDPIFAYPPDGRTGGELSAEEKLAHSHRGAAFRQFRAWLEAQPVSR